MLELDEADGSCMIPVVVSSVVHQCSVHVNEKGTEAAAATELEMLGFGLSSDPEMVVDFVADRPFLFIIRQEEKQQHNSGAVVFAGQFVNPLLVGKRELLNGNLLNHNSGGARAAAPCFSRVVPCCCFSEED